MKPKHTIFILLFSCVFLLSACHHKNKSDQAQKTHIVVAKLETPIQRLYFTGTLAPINTSYVLSPVAGNISALYFSYGGHVEKSQKILMIDSKQLAENYRKAISTFIQKKQAFVTGKTTFEGAQALDKAGAIAKNEYVTDKTQYENAELEYLQSKYDLEKILHTAKVDPKSIEALSLADTQKVNTILERHFRHLDISANGSGIALFPSGKTTDDRSSSSSASGKLEVGTDIKEGQLLLSIGDLSGLSASFDVSEVDIDRIHAKMPVIVTGDAFPGVQLKGFIKSVSAQAKKGAGQGLSMFAVKTEIPTIDHKIMEKIRVGMTAKFEVDIKSAPRILLPVNAVFKKNGVSVVNIMDNGKEKEVPVVTGDTTLTDVVIISGVKAGDKVVVQ